MLVSVIVVSYCRAQDLRLVLEAILASTHRALEVIVVDNASTDDAPEVAASFAGVRVVRNERNLGFAEANNIGQRLSTGRYVALVNDDAVVESTWVEGLVRFLEAHPKAAAAGGKLYVWNDEHPVGDRSGPYHGSIGMLPSDSVREVPTLSGSAVMIRRAAIDDVGEPFLDPLFFMYYEETDFFARAIRKGWRLYNVATPACWHRAPESDTGRPYHFHYYMNRNRLLFAHRHFDAANLRRFVARCRRRALLAALRLPLGRLTGKAVKYRARRDAWRWGVRNQDLLREQRARWADPERPYHDLLRAIEARALERPTADEQGLPPGT